MNHYVADRTWTHIPGTGIEVWQATGANVVLSVEPYGRDVILPRLIDGSAWHVRGYLP